MFRANCCIVAPPTDWQVNYCERTSSAFRRAGRRCRCCRTSAAGSPGGRTGARHAMRRATPCCTASLAWRTRVASKPADQQHNNGCAHRIPRPHTPVRLVGPVVTGVAGERGYAEYDWCDWWVERVAQWDDHNKLRAVAGTGTASTTGCRSLRCSAWLSATKRQRWRLVRPVDKSTGGGLEDRSEATLASMWRFPPGLEPSS